MRLLERLFGRHAEPPVDDTATALLTLPHPGRHRAEERPEDVVSPRALTDAQVHRLTRTWRDGQIPPVVVRDRLGAVVAARLEAQTRPTKRSELRRDGLAGGEHSELVRPYVVRSA
jgi:hypothetical protein